MKEIKLGLVNVPLTKLQRLKKRWSFGVDPDPIRFTFKDGRYVECEPIPENAKPNPEWQTPKT